MATQESKTARDPFNVTRQQVATARMLASGLKLVMRAQKYSKLPPTMLTDFVNGVNAINGVFTALSEERDAIVLAMEKAALERAQRKAAGESASKPTAKPKGGR